MKRTAGRRTADKPGRPKRVACGCGHASSPGPKLKLSSRSAPRRACSLRRAPRFRISFYCTVSSPDKRKYRSADRLRGFGPLLCPRSAVLANVFVNGMPQPPGAYVLRRGSLVLRTNDPLPAGIPILVQYLHYGRTVKGGEVPMPIIKPVFAALSSTPVATGGAVSTVVNPLVTKFYTVVTAGAIGATTTTLPAATFVDDADVPVAALPAPPTAGHYNVYINGILQQSSLAALSTVSLVLATIDLLPGVPVLLELVDYSNTASALTTPPTISTPTITILS